VLLYDVISLMHTDSQSFTHFIPKILQENIYIYILSCFDFYRYISFTKLLDICYVFVYSEICVFSLENKNDLQIGTRWYLKDKSIFTNYLHSLFWAIQL
jgi:hypothetical protein